MTGLPELSLVAVDDGEVVGHVLCTHATLGLPVVVLLGDHRYYSRFGFRLAQEIGVTPPVDSWAPHFQARTLTTYQPDLRGPFAYAAPLDRV